MADCISTVCDQPAQPQHDPCCSAHRHALCCAHYNRRHHIEVHRCKPEDHAADAERRALS